MSQKMGGQSGMAGMGAMGGWSGAMGSKGAAEIQTKNGEGDIFLECKVSDVLDCSSRKLNSSVGSISILLFIDYKG